MKLMLSNIWGWAFNSSLYLEKMKSNGEFAIYLITQQWSMGVLRYHI